MGLQFHNQLTKTIDAFIPIQEGEVSLYTCGPTVYSTPTVGNWASYIHWDTLVRTLTAHGLNVTRVMNITDVGHLVSDADDGEDKLEKGARKEGKTAWEVAQFYTDDFITGMNALNLIPPTHIPRATNYIDQQLALVQTLKDRGYTYQISDGIYYDTSKFPTYGAFAGLDVDAQKAGARVELNPEKRNPSDFALWKFTPEGQVRDMEWDTPAELTETGVSLKGFPGWHLECSAMAIDLLGETIDIHTGGIDHIPVHHTNEIAQSEAATGKQFAHYWMHTNHLKVDGTKISKSLGNGYTLHDLSEKGFDALDLRMAVLQGHYRSEGNFTLDTLQAARNRRNNWRAVAALRHQIHDTLERNTDAPDAEIDTTIHAIYASLADDLNTPEALAHIDAQLHRIASMDTDAIHDRSFNQLIETIDDTLGLALADSTPDISDEQKQQIITRLRAREEKDFARSDAIRNALLAEGIALKDTTHGTTWSYAV